MRSIRCLLVMLLPLPTPAAFAQELSLLFGRLTTESAEDSYSWQREYCHRLGRVTWNRVATGYSRDTDVFLLGLGYRF